MQIQWRPGASIPDRDGREPEWLVTNGIGGFASGTVIGVHRRRYHGLLIASLQPPVERRLLWVKNDEWIETASGRHPLATNDYGDTIYPDGWCHVFRFHLYPFPTTIFFVAGVMLQRTVFMVQGQNTTVVMYRLLTAPSDVEISIDLLVNGRDYHHTTSAAHMTGGQFFSQNEWSFGTALRAYDGAPELIIGAGCSDPEGAKLRYEAQPVWYYNFHYALERHRGLGDVEDHFRPGVLRWRPQGAGDIAVVVGHCPEPAFGRQPPWTKGPAALLRWSLERYDEEVARLRNLLQSARRHRTKNFPLQETISPRDHGEDRDWARLILAADAFVARRRTTGAATILAGYPWFTDWGRDAMISLPGLLLSTGRFQLAKEVLLTFAHHREGGLIPNRFPDDGGSPLYNTVDASLWFVWALWHYYERTGDVATLRHELLPVAQDIVHHYATGTRHGIGLDADGLVRAKDPGLQLTWMDAKAGDWVVTPRDGLPVEINALWYNALRTVATLCKVHDRAAATQYERLALAVRRAFLRRFIRPDGSLYDVVSPRRGISHRPQGGDARMRPNQIFAASLPYPVVGKAAARRIVRHVTSRLLTPVGLRTLATDQPDYVGVYEGDQTRRDAAYHQGTVWPWLLGPFVTAWRQSGQKPRSLPFTAALRAHLRGEAALGHVSEIFTGDAPHEPRGCFAQAWSVAEWLRVWDEGAGDEDGVGTRAHAYRGDYGRT